MCRNFLARSRFYWLGGSSFKEFYIYFGSGGCDVGLGFEGATLLTKVYSIFDLNCTPRLFTMSSASAIRTIRRAGGVANIIDSTVNPVVNTGMLRGNAAGNMVASVSNGFTLGIGPKTAVMISFVNCIDRRVGVAGRAAIGVALGRSSRVLSRIIIIKCNAVGGDSLSNTSISVDRSGVGNSVVAGLSRSLRKHTTNIATIDASNTPNSSSSVHMHNRTAVGTGTRPLCMVSNIVMRDRKRDNSSCNLNSTLNGNSISAVSPLSAVGPTSVIDVRVLGSTSTATVCNTRNSGNIILVAAGHNGTNRTGFACSNVFTIRHRAGHLSVVGLHRCTACCGSLTGVNRVSSPDGCCTSPSLLKMNAG